MTTVTAAPAATPAATPHLRWRRLGATLIDLAIFGPAALIIMLVTGIVESAEAWVFPQPIIRLSGLLVATYLLLNIFLLITNGQTLGKRLLGVRIESSRDGSLLPVWQLLIRAYGIVLIDVVISATFGADLAIYVLLLAPLYLFNVLFIFGKPQRCLHDYLARSVVVAAPVAADVAVAPVIEEAPA